MAAVSQMFKSKKVVPLLTGAVVVLGFVGITKINRQVADSQKELQKYARLMDSANVLAAQAREQLEAPGYSNPRDSIYCLRISQAYGLAGPVRRYLQESGWDKVDNGGLASDILKGERKLDSDVGHLDGRREQKLRDMVLRQ